MARRLLRVLRLLVALGILAWLAVSVWRDWDAVARLGFEPAPLDVVLALACAAGGLLGLAGLFVLQVRVLGLYHSRHARFYPRIWLQGYFYRYVPGKVMLVVERVRLGQAVGIPTATSVVLVVWETLLLVVGAALLAALGAATVERGPLPGWAPPLLAGAGLAGLLAFPVALRVAARRVRALATRIPPLVLGVPFRTQVGLALGYAVVWALLGASFAFTCRWFAAGSDTGTAAAVAFVLSYVTGLVVGVTPAGLGIREGLLVVGLGALYPAPTALAFGVANRLLMTTVELLLVGAACTVLVPPAGKAE